MVGPDTRSREVDLRALSAVTTAAVISLVNAVIGVVSLFVTPGASLGDTATSGSNPSITFALTSLYILAAVAGVGLVLELIQLWFYRSAFRDLSRIDLRFSTPSKLTLLALISLVLIAAVGAGLIVVLYQAITCAGAGNAITGSCVSTGSLLGLIVLLGLFGIMALIGWIGFLIGVWRLGTHYGESLFKAGAVLLIFPFLDIIGIILILVAVRKARGRLSASGGMPSFGGAPSR